MSEAMEATLATSDTQEAGAAETATTAKTAHNQLIGTRVGSYLVRRLMAKGGMGVIYEGEHESLGQRVANKLLHGNLNDDAKAADRFFNEARAVSIVQHPGLVRILDFQKLPDGTPYLVMEFLTGEPLDRRLIRQA